MLIGVVIKLKFTTGKINHVDKIGRVSVATGSAFDQLYL